MSAIQCTGSHRRMHGGSLAERLASCGEWPSRFPPNRWAMYKCVLGDAEREQIRIAVGGGLAASVYGGKWRDSKDIDLYVRHRDLDRMHHLLARNGLCDYFDIKPYDRNWIYRSYFRDTIVDVMWAMANQRSQVDDAWLSGPEVRVDGIAIRLLPPEQTLWTKLYVLQFDRCDWPDAINLLYTSGPELDWDRMLALAGDDKPLLASMVNVFAWVCPGIAAKLPEGLWTQLGLQHPSGGQDYDARRANLLDTRCWLAAMVHAPGE